MSSLLHTIVALGNAVLYPAALGKIRNLGPILIGICGTAESAAGAVAGVLPGSRSSRVGVLVLRHGEHVGLCASSVALQLVLLYYLGVDEKILLLCGMYYKTGLEEG